MKPSLIKIANISPEPSMNSDAKKIKPLSLIALNSISRFRSLKLLSVLNSRNEQFLNDGNMKEEYSDSQKLPLFPRGQ